jgi:hypothetical protein
MRFFKNLYRSALAVAVGALALTSCQPEESPLSRAIMTSVSGMQFAAQNAEPQTITVYADAEWTVEAPEWVTVDKTEGNRTMEVTISVGDNMRDGALDNPKKDTIVFRGYNLLAHAYVIVMQDGDKYRDVPATDVAGILTMKDEDVVILDDAQVVAASTKGFVVSDGTAEAFVVSSETVAVGDKVDIKGSKGTWNELPAVTICDEVNVTGNAAVAYPSTTDITASIDTYAPSKMELVEITGSLEGMNVLVEGAARVGVVLDPTDDINVNELNGHNVTVKGYSAGATVSVVNVIATEIVDLGVNEIIYYADDFEWFSDLALTEGAGDAVGTDDPGTTAPNVWKMGTSADFFSRFNERGYQYLYSKVGMTEFEPGPAQEPNSKVGKDGSLYIQSNYLKFGQTSYSGALRLPALSAIQGAANVQIEFDWCWQVTGAYKPDLMTLSVDATVGQFADTAGPTSAALESTQSTVDGDSHIVWQHVVIVLNGATAETVLTIRPTNADPDVQNPVRHQNRWYLDNIKITDLGGAVVPPSGPKTYFEETWDWVSPWADVYGSADSVGENDHSGKAPNVYTQKSHLAYDGVGYADGGAGVEGYPSFLEAFAERGYTDLNPAGQVMYTQKYYMKFGKTNVHTGITLPSNEFMGDKPVDVEVSFNWCAHMISKEPYTFDKVQMVIEITGPGTCADSNSKVSNAYDTHQQNGLMEWQDFSVRVNGVTKDTKITIRPLNWDKIDKDGADYKVQRYHLDNILIQSAR